MKKIVVGILLLLLFSNLLIYWVFDEDNQDDKNKTIQIDHESTDILVPEWLNSWPVHQFSTNIVNGIFVYDDYIYASSFTSVLLKMDLEGNVIWNKMWKSDDYVQKSNAVYVYDYAVYVSVSVSKVGEKDFKTYLLKYDMDGNLLWNSTFGIEKDYIEFSIVVTDDAVYTTGYVRPKMSPQVLILKYDKDGNIIWNRTWARTDMGLSIASDDDFIYVAGNSGSYDGDSIGSSIFLIKYNHNGELIWEQEWDQVGSDYCTSLLLDSDSIYIGGHTCNGIPNCHHDALLVKFNKKGKFEWKLTWDLGNYTGVRSMFLYDGNIYLTGTTSFIHATNYITLTKLSREGEHIKTWLWDYSTYEYTASIFVKSGSVYLGGRNGYGGFLLRFDE